jgi:hypothetical protein
MTPLHPPTPLRFWPALGRPCESIRVQWFAARPSSLNMQPGCGSSPWPLSIWQQRLSSPGAAVSQQAIAGRNLAVQAAPHRPRRAPALEDRNSGSHTMRFHPDSPVVAAKFFQIFCPAKARHRAPFQVRFGFRDLENTGAPIVVAAIVDPPTAKAHPTANRTRRSAQSPSALGSNLLNCRHNCS